MSYIINKKIKYHLVLFSPHLDDAILSCYIPIINSLEKKQKILLVSFFTSAQVENISSDSKNFINGSGEKNAFSLFSKRKKEDQKICKKLKIDYLHLNFIDAGFRLNKNKALLYPNNKKIFSNKINLEDKELINQLKKEIIFIKNNFSTKDTTFYAPLGIGNHIDHLIINKIVKKIITKKLFFWEDVPYRNNPLALIEKLTHLKIKKSYHLINKNPQYKYKIVNLYKSQIDGLKKSGFSTYDLYYEKIYTTEKS